MMPIAVIIFEMNKSIFGVARVNVDRVRGTLPVPILRRRAAVGSFDHPSSKTIN